MQGARIETLNLEAFDPVGVFLAAQRHLPRVAFLHTCPGSPRERWSILTWGPRRTLALSPEEGAAGWLEDLREATGPLEARLHPHLPFTGGAVGYYSYDLGHVLKGLPYPLPEGPALPLAVTGLYDNALLFDHRQRQVHVAWRDRSFLREGRRLCGRPAGRGGDPGRLGPVRCGLAKEDYLGAVATLQGLLQDGEIYQANLTWRLSADCKVDPGALFECLVDINPAPMAAFLGFEGFEVLSLSPERFLSVRDRQVVTTPIKGTRPRGADRREDARLVRELMADGKEKAELHMITDLLRNDLGITAEVGSVEVTRRRALQRCPSVWHTWSEIRARLDPRYTSVDLVASCLPGGSVTGCPKRRAMEILAGMETVRRGVYTGAIGYHDYRGDGDFNLAIRTFVHEGGRLVYGVGGGIVVDSDPEAEYRECQDKARVFFDLEERLGIPT